MRAPRRSTYTVGDSLRRQKNNLSDLATHHFQLVTGRRPVRFPHLTHPLLFLPDESVSTFAVDWRKIVYTLIR